MYHRDRHLQSDSYSRWEISKAKKIIRVFRYFYCFVWKETFFNSKYAEEYQHTIRFNSINNQGVQLNLALGNSPRLVEWVTTAQLIFIGEEVMAGGGMREGEERVITWGEVENQMRHWEADERVITWGEVEHSKVWKNEERLRICCDFNEESILFIAVLTPTHLRWRSILSIMKFLVPYISAYQFVCSNHSKNYFSDDKMGKFKFTGI